jgi:ribonuclease HII
MGLSFDLEDQACTRSANLGHGRVDVAGIDEVGVGPLAGPVVAAAVVLPKRREPWYDRINDSKKLKPKQRKELYDLITIGAEGIGVGWVDAKEIDRVGISMATKLAMVHAFDLCSLLFNGHLIAVVDDLRIHCISNQLGGEASVFANKADGISLSVAAASIVAKVLRDEHMNRMALEYPQYAFEQHKGYGTRKHLRKLVKYGPCVLHRTTFAPVRAILSTQ